ncbi:MAG: RsmD family RNA methyltransferase, partial [Alphaproteobacteria bacterium]
MRKRANANQRQLRIIGGIWRGRKLAFPELPGLRPTPDRVRETVFNWLAPTVQGAPSPFADVDPAAYYAEPVAWMAALGITGGTGPDTFS